MGRSERLKIILATNVAESSITIEGVRAVERLPDPSGRLLERTLLADGLTLAVEETPDAVIDLATLTGAAVVALGKEIAGVLGNDDELIAAEGRYYTLYRDWATQAAI